MSLYRFWREACLKGCKNCKTDIMLFITRPTTFRSTSSSIFQIWNPGIFIPVPSGLRSFPGIVINIYFTLIIFSGNLDQMMPCVVTSEHYRTWKWSSSDDFIKAVRNPYMFKNRLAGYVRLNLKLTAMKRVQ